MLQKATTWSQDFLAHADQHANVEVASPAKIDRRRREVLGRSLSTFQIGESGTGEHLFAAAATATTSRDYRTALTAFVKEEQEHARMLALVLDVIDYPLRTSHWSDRVFVFIRRVKSLRTEVLTLLVAELIALTYYSTLRDGVAEFADIFGRIHADELRHVDFHAETLPIHIAEWSPRMRGSVRLLWNVLVTGTSLLVALDHRRALRLGGLGPATFMRRVWGDRRDLDRRLFRTAALL